MTTATTWKCEVCGFIHQGPEPPATCPICGVDGEMFSPLEAPSATAPRTADAWRCSICDHVASGDERPGKCPVCGAGGELFDPEEGEQATGAAPASGPIAIIGTGVAGLTAAERARVYAPDAAIIVVGKEPELPYFRLNLTRLLAGEVDEQQLSMHQSDWFAEQRVELVADEVSKIDIEARSIHLRGAEPIAYERLVLANGSHPFVPPFAGATRRGVHVLRTLADARAILSELRPGARCVCVGGGLLGLEAAGALRRRGAEVTIVESFGHLLPRQLPEPAGRMLERYIEAQGIGIARQAQVEEIGGDESVRGVTLQDGRELEAEMVIISTGVRPNSYLARQADLKVDRGVIVDDRMVTSHPDVLACGDVAEHRGEVHGIWPVAYAQGAVAGVNAAGGDAEYQGVPRSNRLKVMDVDLFSIGMFATADGSYQVYESAKEETYTRLVCRDGRLLGAVLFGDTTLAGPVREAVESGRQLQDAGELLECMPEFTKHMGIDRPATARIPDSTAKEKKMPSIKGTQTEQNLLKAFAGESQARNRYTYASKVARKAGLVQIANIFEETAENERVHAKAFFKFLEGGAVEITASYPAGVIGDTQANLLAAAEGEHEEWTELYPAFAAKAREEGFPKVAAAFEQISKAEKAHETRYRKLLARLQDGTTFKREQPVRWKCNVCGYIHEGPEPPETCPACQHPKNYYEEMAENY